MKIPQTLLLLLGIITTIHALALPTSLARIVDTSKSLFTRKGGGGGRGSSGSSISSGSSSSSSSSSRSGISSATSNTGGRTASGSGLAPSYGSSGRYYGGGASSPYSAGARSPGGVAPYFLAGSALAFFPGVWLYGAYAYPYHGAYTYHNDTGQRNETRPVQCFCAQYASAAYLSSVANNATVSRVADVNGTSTLLINGTLENGTTASGGSDSGAGSFRLGVVEKGSGGWLVIAMAAYALWVI
ncbi:hypothetical protein LTR29_002393 [Friedmanniomyces endolithicus]|nr:hypothetical protein LTR29_002393 [Friedmanniomyces endolithicus]